MHLLMRLCIAGCLLTQSVPEVNPKEDVINDSVGTTEEQERHHVNQLGR